MIPPPQLLTFLQNVNTPVAQLLGAIDTGQRAGNTDHGQHAGRNTGISVVREGRELVRVAPMVGRHDERNRWWGCEISFDSGLDALFGVDHNKQMASHLTSIAEGFADSDRLSYQIADEAGEDSPWMPLYQIVRDIRDNTASMRREVIRTLQQKRTQTPVEGEEDTTPTGVSVGLATAGNRRVEEEGEVPPTNTDIVRLGMDDESKAQEHKKELVMRGYDEEAAERLARVMVDRGDRYAFVSDKEPRPLLTATGAAGRPTQLPMPWQPLWFAWLVPDTPGPTTPISASCWTSVRVLPLVEPRSDASWSTPG